MQRTPGDRRQRRSGGSSKGMKIFQTERLREWREAIRRDGIRGFIRTYGRTLLFWFILIYLIRDTILYILIPYLVAKGLLSTFPQLEKVLP